MRKECRPPPPFEEQERSIICSIAFDQTYARAGAGTGWAKYTPLQTVDMHGERKSVERMVYINGQFLPASRAATKLSAAAVGRVAATGPYTQDFRRILPLLALHLTTSIRLVHAPRVVPSLGAHMVSRH